MAWHCCRYLLTRAGIVTGILLAGFLPFWIIAFAQVAHADSCSFFDVGCHISGLASGFIDMLAQAFVTAVGNVVKAISTFWLSIPTPQLATDAQGTPSDTVGFLQSSLGFFTWVLATLSLAVGLARIAWASRSGGHSREIHSTVRALVTFMAVTTMGLAAVWAGVQVGDAFSTWIIDRSTGGTDFNANITAVLGLTAISGLGAVLIAFVAFFDMIAGVMQVIAMIGRGIALVLVAGVWPTAAAFRTLDAGEAWYRRITAWIIGLVCYKPAVAIVYATAFRMIGQNVFGNDGLINLIGGLLTLIFAVFAGPMLARFAVPLVAAARMPGGGGGGEAVGAAVSGAAVVGGYVASHKGATGGGGGPQGAGPQGGGASPGGLPAPRPAPAGAAAPTAGAAGAGTAAAGAAGPAVAAAGQLASGAVNGVRRAAGNSTGEQA